jgi:hypothetical protein
MVNLSGNEVICWSKNGSQESNNTGFWHSSVLGLDGGRPKRDLWKLAAAIGLLNLTSLSLADLDRGEAEKIGLQACFQHPYVLVIGNVEAAKGEGLYSITCQGCNLTTCICSHNKDRDILIVVQPPYVLVPTNILGDWYDDRDLQVVKEIKEFLLREKRMWGQL